MFVAFPDCTVLLLLGCLCFVCGSELGLLNDSTGGALKL
jgi:hypothetical protein